MLCRLAAVAGRAAWPALGDGGRAGGAATDAGGDAEAGGGCGGGDADGLGSACTGAGLWVAGGGGGDRKRCGRVRGRWRRRTAARTRTREAGHICLLIGPQRAGRVIVDRSGIRIWLGGSIGRRVERRIGGISGSATWRSITRGVTSIEIARRTRARAGRDPSQGIGDRKELRPSEKGHNNGRPSFCRDHRRG